MQHVNIISRDNGAGLSREIRILSQTLKTKGLQITISQMSVSPAYSPFYRPLLSVTNRIVDFNKRLHHRQLKSQFDLNIFLERIYPEWMECAQINCLIPNQERFPDECMPYLDNIDLVLCKTRHAQTIFSQLGCATEYISFTSQDRYNLEIPKTYDTPFHLAGNSREKGTLMLIDIWQKHPEWPELTIVQRPFTAKKTQASNIRQIDRYLDDDKLRLLQNTHGIHLCPSETEGFGHYIVEGMSAQAVTVVTDAPPMNELIADDRSFLVKHTSNKPFRLGSIYAIDPKSLEEKISEAIEMDLTHKTDMGIRAREWFLENDNFFKGRLVEVVSGL